MTKEKSVQVHAVIPVSWKRLLAGKARQRRISLSRLIGEILVGVEEPITVLFFQEPYKEEHNG